MKKVLSIIVLFAVFALGTIFIIPTVNAEETTEPTTEEVIETEEVVESEEYDIYVDNNGTLYINGEELDQDQLQQIITSYLVDNFGEVLGQYQWILYIVGSVITIGVVLIIRKLGQLIFAWRELNSTNETAITLQPEINNNTTAIRDVELKASKNETLLSLNLEMMLDLMANSSNKAYVTKATYYREQIQKALKTETVIEKTNFVKDVVNVVKETEIGKQLETTVEEKKDLINEILGK